MKKRINRLTAIVTAMAFLWNSVVWAGPGISLESAVHSPMARNIYIPEQYGRIEAEKGTVPLEKRGQSPFPLVVLIKDAHCHYEAQHNIAKILEVLVRDYGINLHFSPKLI